MKTIKIAVPCHSPGGLMSDRSEHFGHCDNFTLIVIADGTVTDVQVIDNIDHCAGSCMEPIELLKKNNVDIIIVSGMGSKPLKKIAETGIGVYFAPRHYSEEVYSVVRGFVEGKFTDMKKIQTCRTQGKFHQLDGSSEHPKDT